MVTQPGISPNIVHDHARLHSYVRAQNESLSMYVPYYLAVTFSHCLSLSQPWGGGDAVRARAAACRSPAASLTTRCLPTPGKSTLVGATCERGSKGEREEQEQKQGQGQGREGVESNARVLPEFFLNLGSIGRNERRTNSIGVHRPSDVLRTSVLPCRRAPW